jgi:hypothetical protein
LLTLLPTRQEIPVSSHIADDKEIRNLPGSAAKSTLPVPVTNSTHYFNLSEWVRLSGEDFKMLIKIQNLAAKLVIPIAALLIPMIVGAKYVQWRQNQANILESLQRQANELNVTIDASLRHNMVKADSEGVEQTIARISKVPTIRRTYIGCRRKNRPGRRQERELPDRERTGADQEIGERFVRASHSRECSSLHARHFPDLLGFPVHVLPY